MSFRWKYSRYKTPSFVQINSLTIQKNTWKYALEHTWMSVSWNEDLFFYLEKTKQRIYHNRILFEVYFVSYKLILLLSPFISRTIRQFFYEFVYRNIGRAFSFCFHTTLLNKRKKYARVIKFEIMVLLNFFFSFFRKFI